MATPVEQIKPAPKVCYKILRGEDMVDLADAVNLNIEAGWMPIGGVCYVPPGLQDLTATGQVPHPFWQAMVRDG